VVSDYVNVAGGSKGICDVLGKQLPWVEFTDEQLLQGMQQAGLPAEMANLYTEMGTAIREGKLQRISRQTVHHKLVLSKIQAFAKEFAGAF
jgi:hypothetical protein